jgi:hypothetical protein
VSREPKPGSWFPSGQATCNNCQLPFAFKSPKEFKPEKDRTRAVIYQPVRCPNPVCRSTSVPVQRSVLPIRYHRCRDCGETFKSVEK